MVRQEAQGGSSESSTHLDAPAVDLPRPKHHRHAHAALRLLPGGARVLALGRGGRGRDDGARRDGPALRREEVVHAAACTRPWWRRC